MCVEVPTSEVEGGGTVLGTPGLVSYTTGSRTGGWYREESPLGGDPLFHIPLSAYLGTLDLISGSGLGWSAGSGVLPLFHEGEYRTTTILITRLISYFYQRTCEFFSTSWLCLISVNRWEEVRQTDLIQVTRIKEERVYCPPT